jgi:hypothetical protein
MGRNFKSTGTSGSTSVDKLSSELNTMRKELEDMKEVLRGLIQVIMSRDGPVDEDEYN